MTEVDPDLAEWELGQRRRSQIMGGLAAGFLVSVVALVALVFLFVRPVLETSRQSDCMAEQSAAFYSAIGDLSDARGDPQREPRALEALRRQTANMERIASGEDPC